MSASYKRLSFTNEEEENLIEFIKQHPALWDASHVGYGNGELRKMYWLSIATELNKTVFECRRKWRFIRDYYIHKRRRINECTSHRDGKYFSLHFLDKVAVRKFGHQQRETTNSQFSNQSRNDKTVTKNIVKKVEQDFEDSGAEYNYTSDVTFEKVTMERIDQVQDYLLDDEDGMTNPDSNDDPAVDVTSNEDLNYDESSTNQEFPRELKSEENEEEHLVEVHSEPEVEEVKPVDTSMQEKAIDLFFKSMAAAVKTFPPQYVAEAKLKVFTAINELEMKVHSSGNDK